MSDILLYLLLGAAAGLLAGLLGIGGGLITVPALAYLFPTQGIAPQSVMHLAIGTSLAAMTVTTAMSAYAHHRHGAVNWSVWRHMVAGLALGSMAGALAVDYLRTDTLRVVFGVFELLLAAHIAFGDRSARRSALPSPVKIATASLLIGAVCALLGIGGGLFVVPYLLWHGINMRAAVSTSAATGVAIAGAGALTFLVLGMDAPHASNTWGHIHQTAFAGLAIGSLITAPLGARLAHRLPAQQLRRVFAVFIGILGVIMVTG